jgi:hypothetical protein
MEGRVSIVNCQHILSKLGFRKQESGGLVGLLLKSLLSRDTLGINKDHPVSFTDQFKFLTKSEIVRVLEYGAELWMSLKKIHQTACNRSESSEGNAHLRGQFEDAHDFFVQKMEAHNQVNGLMFKKVLEILKREGGNTRKLNIKKVEASSGD